MTVGINNNKSQKPMGPRIIPLTKTPPSVASINTNQKLTYTVPPALSTTLGADSPDSELYVDLYASNHGCEEFYYSNAPDQYASTLQTCGGGVYREIQVCPLSYYFKIIFFVL